MPEMWSAGRFSPLAAAPAFARRVHPDVVAGLVLVGATVVGAWDVLRPGGTTVGLDAVAFFWPMFSFLGERLRAGDIPGWNPHQFAGAPFAADPESGWTYLPAMILFALLPLPAAARAFSFSHLLLAGLGTYALARVLGIGRVGAIAAAVAFEFGGIYADRVRCCFAHVQVMSWLPLLLLGVELALRGDRWLTKAVWWGVSGFALSQILAGWVGQGAYYALVAFGGYVGYRTLVDPPAEGRSGRGGLRAAGARVGTLVLHGGAVVAIGSALAAAGVLPRLAYHARSNLAEGYTGDLAWAAEVPGWPWRYAAELLLGPTGWYVGGGAAGLAIVAPIAARGRHATPFFATLAVAGLVLATERTTPLHRALYALLPAFEELHRHAPSRVLGVASLGPALLAGAAVGALPRWRARPLRLAIIAWLPILFLLWLAGRVVPVADRAWVALLAVCLIVTASPRLPRRAGPLGAGLLVVVIFADLVTAARENVARGLFATVDLAVYDEATGAAAFLRARGGEEGADRFFGYDPAIRSEQRGQVMLYRHEYRDPRTVALVVNNRATLLRLADLQGYNPIQDRRYVEFMAALNGHPQEYHGAYVFASGLDSPLLDLLNARYVVVPAVVPLGRTDLGRLVEAMPTVYRDGEVRVLENREALPRAWIVHEARRVEAGEALPLLASGAVDPRRTALVEVAPPALAPATDRAGDEAVVVERAPDRLRVRTKTDAPGLLVLSEVYDPGWRAEVDGEPTPVHVADHALRAVPILAGEHAVELRYEPPGLRLGLAITVAASAALAVVMAAAWRGRGRRIAG